MNTQASPMEITISTSETPDIRASANKIKNTVLDNHHILVEEANRLENEIREKDQVIECKEIYIKTLINENQSAIGDVERAEENEKRAERSAEVSFYLMLISCASLFIYIAIDFLRPVFFG
jgi:hypothetical protein